MLQAGRYQVLSSMAVRCSSIRGPPGRIAWSRVSREYEKVIRNSILLREDELQMRRNGYISGSTYRVWAEGMRDQLNQPMFIRSGPRSKKKLKSIKLFLTSIWDNC